ncbi:jacalin-related lectin 19-like [Macadamia integrifolia]|uniref:jacalin-related lectin 19-like n=1 Tax=Macadamia integrifolia TaxID=60698 RepID=UPI001C4FED50|nr:jacalin-related lectin 19-like [Macadamia integrifolia]
MSREVISEEKPMKVGPWGGQGGSHWDDGVYTDVRQLSITHGQGIDSLHIEYVDLKGSFLFSVKHGGKGGSKTDKVILDYPNEFVTSIHGHYGNMSSGGPVFIRSLTIESNKKTYGPYGVEQGTKFSFQMMGGKIVGFHGKSGIYMDSIGVYVKHFDKPTNDPPKDLVISSTDDHKLITSATDPPKDLVSSTDDHNLIATATAKISNSSYTANPTTSHQTHLIVPLFLMLFIPVMINLYVSLMLCKLLKGFSY